MAKFLILLIIKMGFAFMALSLLYSFMFAKYSSLMENNLPDFTGKVTTSKFANALDAYDKGNYGAAFSELTKAVEETDASEELQAALEELYAERHNEQAKELSKVCLESGGTESGCND